MTDLSNFEDLEREAIDWVATPGFRFFAPAGTEAPVAGVRDGRFTDTWPLAWLPLHETLPGTPLLRLTSFQRVTGAEAMQVNGRSQTWIDIDIPPGSIAVMIGWESGRSDLRVVGQSVMEMSYFDAFAKIAYAR